VRKAGLHSHGARLMATLKGKALIAYLVVCVFWGSTYLAIKVGVTDLPPVLFAGLRFLDRKSTRLNSSHVPISYAVFCLKKKMLPSTYPRSSTSISRAQSLRTSSSSQRVWIPLKIRGHQALSR